MYPFFFQNVNRLVVGNCRINFTVVVANDIVADYGMQVNILNRYGIRSFAVAGKDYLFLNGDDTDFRHENLQIVNRYQGVTEVIFRGKHRYRARINVPMP